MCAKYYKQHYSVLQGAKNAKGVHIYNLATAATKTALDASDLWFSRFTVTDFTPIHTSATCFVFRAMEETTGLDGKAVSVPVAIKLMRVYSQYLREISTRDHGFKNEHVINIFVAQAC